MTYTQTAVLGIVQGVTEFLPISSSGHLILVPFLAGWPDQGLAFDAIMHLGTLTALIAYFRVELRAMLRGLGGRIEQSGSRRLALVLVAATVPAGLAGLVFEHTIEAHLRRPAIVASSTIIGGLLLLVADRLAARRLAWTTAEQDVGWGQGLLVGFAQALALVPGTSRSGITITAGLLGGLDRATAARFAFMLGIPTTGAAGALEGLRVVRAGIPLDDRGPLVVGLLAAFASGWLAVWFLVHYLRRNSLMPFVVYRIFLGLALLLAF